MSGRPQGARSRKAAFPFPRNYPVMGAAGGTSRHLIAGLAQAFIDFRLVGQAEGLLLTFSSTPPVVDVHELVVSSLMDIPVSPATSPAMLSARQAVGAAQPEKAKISAPG